MKLHFAAGGRSMGLPLFLAIIPGLFRKSCGERLSNETLPKTGWSCTSDAARYAPPVGRAHGWTWLRLHRPFLPKILPNFFSEAVAVGLRSATSFFNFSARSANVRNCLAQTAPMWIENA
jgi:hypothetical protein